MLPWGTQQQTRTLLPPFLPHLESEAAPEDLHWPVVPLMVVPTYTELGSLAKIMMSAVSEELQYPKVFILAVSEETKYQK